MFVWLWKRTLEDKLKAAVVQCSSERNAAKDKFMEAVRSCAQEALLESGEGAYSEIIRQGFTYSRNMGMTSR